MIDGEDGRVIAESMLNSLRTAGTPGANIDEANGLTFCQRRMVGKSY